MGEQAVELRSVLSVLRRRWGVLIAAAVLGAVAGLCFVLLRPPMYSSISQVLLPRQSDTSGQVIEPDVKTQVQVAGSEAVLGPVAENLDPRRSVKNLEGRVEVSSPADYVLQFEASAEDPDGAESLAKALAESQVDYLNDSTSSRTNAEQSVLSERLESLQSSLSSVRKEIRQTENRIEDASAIGTDTSVDESALAQLTAKQADLVMKIDEVKEPTASGGVDGEARTIQGSSPAERPNLASRYAVAALIGVLVALSIASAIIVARSRRDRRLWYRDDLADALGGPVIASVRALTPQDITGWTSLLQSYAPDSVDEWALRRALRDLASDESEVGSTAHDGRPPHPDSITIFALADDSRGIALGPQLASYAAAAGIRTHFIVAEQNEYASALWAACRSRHEDARPNLKVSARVRPTSCDLMIVLAMVDRNTTEIVGLPQTDANVLAVSAGSATAEDIARIAVSADAAGSPIDGLLVADPDSLDKTSGRLVRPERAHQEALPERLTGVPAAPDTVADVVELRERSK